MRSSLYTTLLATTAALQPVVRMRTRPRGRAKVTVYARDDDDAKPLEYYGNGDVEPSVTTAKGMLTPTQNWLRRVGLLVALFAAFFVANMDATGERDRGRCRAAVDGAMTRAARRHRPRHGRVRDRLHPARLGDVGVLAAHRRRCQFGTKDARVFSTDDDPDDRVRRSAGVAC